MDFDKQAAMISRGGIKLEFVPGVPDDVRWRARMRNHSGMGATMREAAWHLVEATAAEAEAARAFFDTLPIDPPALVTVEAQP